MLEKDRKNTENRPEKNGTFSGKNRNFLSFQVSFQETIKVYVDEENLRKAGITEYEDVLWIFFGGWGVGGGPNHRQTECLYLYIDLNGSFVSLPGEDFMMLFLSNKVERKKNRIEIQQGS